MMTTEQLRALQTGDIIQSKTTGVSYVVTGNYGDHVTAVKTVDVTHASEWRVIVKRQEQDETKAVR